MIEVLYLQTNTFYSKIEGKKKMSKTVTIRVDDNTYKQFKSHADVENRSLSNFIETATLKYIEETDFADEFEMEEIMKNESLKERLKKGHRDAKDRRGGFVE